MELNWFAKLTWNFLFILLIFGFQMDIYFIILLIITIWCIFFFDVMKVLLTTPTTPTNRMKDIVDGAEGFVYLVRASVKYANFGYFSVCFV